MSTALEEALEAAKSLPAKRQEQNAEVHRRVHDASEEPVSEGEADAFFELSDARARPIYVGSYPAAMK